MKAVCLLSGGLDSATALAVAIDDGYTVTALSFDYGQRHSAELSAARRVALHYKIAHKVIHIGRWSGSALNDQIAVPKDRDEAQMGADIPVTYVPARNTIFLAYATAIAETEGASFIVAGMNAVDYSGYPDCRPEFIEAFQRVIELGTKAGTSATGIGIWTPLIDMGKADIIRLGTKLGAPYHLTHSCYDPRGLMGSQACGRCDSCRIRAKGFADAGVPDPTRYAEVA